VIGDAIAAQGAALLNPASSILGTRASNACLTRTGTSRAAAERD